MEGGQDRLRAHESPGMAGSSKEEDTQLPPPGCCGVRVQAAPPPLPSGCVLCQWDLARCSLRTGHTCEPVPQDWTGDRQT